MAESEHQRLILLNHIVTRSVTRKQEHKPPAHTGYDLLQLIDKRRLKKTAIEYFRATDDDDEAVRAKNGIGHDFIRLRQCRFEEQNKHRYAILLFEYVDQSATSFPVVHTTNFAGREIEGDAAERGATSAHFIIRMPGSGGAYDDGSYRCALEAQHPITRRDIEAFLSRQVRRGETWTFSVDTVDKAGKKITKLYHYHPRFNLFADIGRKMTSLTDGRILTHMLFTKRDEKQDVAKPTSVIHQDIYADVELKVSAKQGPDEPKEQQTWVEAVRQAYALRGFESRLYYRHIHGGILSGAVHQAVDGAADIMMCPKEILTLTKDPKRWNASINKEISDGMIELLDNDELWERSK
jgi:hypothetical protein